MDGMRCPWLANATHVPCPAQAVKHSMVFELLCLEFINSRILCCATFRIISIHWTVGSLSGSWWPLSPSSHRRFCRGSHQIPVVRAVLLGPSDMPTRPTIITKIPNITNHEYPVLQVNHYNPQLFPEEWSSSGSNKSGPASPPKRYT